MSELIAILIVTIAGMLGGNVQDDALSAELSRLVNEKPPVPVEQAEITCTGAGQDGVERIHFVFDEIYLEPLLIDHLEITVNGISPGEVLDIRIEGIEWSALINDTDLTDALRKDNKTLKDATVTMKKDRVSLGGTYPVLKLRIPFEVEGGLTVKDETLLMFNIENNRVSNVNIPRQLNKFIEGEVNPVYDLEAFAKRSAKDVDRIKDILEYTFKIDVTELKLADGQLIVAGTA